MFDVLILGAGPSGLVAAKTILECDEGRVNLRLVDSNKTIGGVWAQENLYPGLRTNNLRGGIDFTDFPMDDSFGVPAGQAIPGEVMHEYLKQYAHRWDILRRIDFETQVLEISRLENDGWNVKVKNKSGVQDLQTKKLVVATGVTNDPHRPSMVGDEDFEGIIAHSAEMGKKAGSILKDPEIRTVAVLGGGKSAYDAVILAASAGKQVEWMMRMSGKGPGWVFPAYTYLGPFKAWREKLPVRRFISCFSPCLWEDGLGWLRKLLHFTSFGLKITRAFWGTINDVTRDECRYRKEPGLNALEPQQSLFWYGTHSGVLHSNEIHEYIRSGQVTIHRGDITHLSKHTIHLSNAINITAQALITATGFSPKPTIDFNPPSSHSDLGVPTTSLTQTQRDFWSHLNHKAELTIVASYPRLLMGPFESPSSNVVQPFNPGVDPELNYTAFRLYRAIAPPGLTTQGDRSLVFIGMFSNISNTIRLELQCLWAYAYLNDKLPIEQETVFEDTALMARYSRYRSPYGHGRYFPDLVFDQVPYFDMLMQDLGLRYWRKKGWFRELFSPYGHEDYSGVVQEWLEKERRRESGKGKVQDSGLKRKKVLHTRAASAELNYG